MNPRLLSRRSILAAAAATGLAGRPAFAQARHAPGPVILAGRGFLSALVMFSTPDGRVGRIVRFGGDSGFRALGENSPFRVASISKLVTALGALVLVGDGAIGLDMDVSDALGPAFRNPYHPDRPITPRMLLTHTSGLRNGDDFPLPAHHSLTETLMRAAGEPDARGWFAPPETPPGWFSYSDTNSAVLAQLIEAVSGERFDRFMGARVLRRPSGQTMGYNWSGVPQSVRDNANPGARWFADGWRAQVDGSVSPAPEVDLYWGDAPPGRDVDGLALARNGFAFAPQGGLRASLMDLLLLGSRFARFREADPELPLAPALRLLTEEPGWVLDPAAANGDTESGFYQSYGFGLQRLTGVTGHGYGDALFGGQSHEWVGHAGDAYGWIAGLWWNTQTGAVITYAINGVPEEGRDLGRRSAFLAAEEELMDEALEVLAALS
jgi:CubicO group peptidase (beta-lactamase class C family)